MNKLIFVTIMWAFSFSLIGVCLKGVDSTFLAFLRVGVALICFLPFMRFNNPKLAFTTAFIGAFQIGVMYLFYYASFSYLSVVEVALFTIFTPFYVTIFYDLFSFKFRKLYLLSVGLAVFGAFIIKFGNINEGFLKGFLLIQGANICFGFGQSAYKFILEKKGLKDQMHNFGFFFLGAIIPCFVAFLIFGDSSKTTLDLTQILVILWLGIGASAVGYFLWNKGACEVDSGVLAIMNNALIPTAILVNLIFFGAKADILKLIIGGGIIYLSLLIHKKIMKYYGLKNS